MIPPLPTDIFHPSQVLNNTYEVEGIIGRGGTGEVYLARNLISGRIVAVKALNRQFSGKDDYIELMRREEQMRDVLHDAVVRYTECSRSNDGHVFLVMDYIEGPSLLEELQKRQLDQRELLILAHRVAEGLDAAHRKGIVHRDLSPDNIIMRGGAAEKATIIDFGIAKDTAAGARTIVGNDFAGKYEYAAPEQLEGKSDARSDLYGLGASLLAAWRGQMPFAGSTPGEIVRRKRDPLDTQGVPEPLKGLIDRLCAPSPADRPASAVAALGLIEEALRRSRGATRTGGAPGRTGRSLRILAMVVAVLAVGAGTALWQLEMLDRFLGAELPLASPYSLSASVEGPPRLEGHAPDEESAALIRRAFEAVSGEMPPEAALTLAKGVPVEGWPAALADLITGAVDLEDWTLDAQDMEVRLAGVAADVAQRDGIAADLAATAEAAGLRLSLDLTAGPKALPVERVRDVLADVATCGRLDLTDPPEEGYALGDTIRISGDLAAPGDDASVGNALLPVIGDRSIQIDADVLNEELCAIRALLPDLPSGGMSVRLLDGETGAPNLPGVFGVGANPVVDIELPSSIEEGWIWVILVDNTGEVFNLLPNVNDTEHRVAEVGVVENGIRRIRVLHSTADFAEDNTRLAFRVSASDFGRSEVIAFLTRKPLFEIRRPRDESVESFAQALAEAEAADPGNLVAIAARVLEARP